MQSIQIINQHRLKAAICSATIALTNVVTIRMVPDAGWMTLSAYVLANAIGVPLAMMIGQRRSITVKEVKKE
jgi:hypothetical protein